MSKENYISMEIPFFTKPDVPNPNGFIYSKQVLENAVKEFYKDKKENNKILYITNIEYEKYYNTNKIIEISHDRFYDIPEENILGTVEDIDIENYNFICNIAVENVKEINRYLENGTKAMMRYIGEVANNRIVGGMRIIAVDINPNN